MVKLIEASIYTAIIKLELKTLVILMFVSPVQLLHDIVASVGHVYPPQYDTVKSITEVVKGR